MSDLVTNLEHCQSVSKKHLDIPAKCIKLCSAVTITGCGLAVRLLGVSSLNLGRADVRPNFLRRPLIGWASIFAILIELGGGLESGQSSDLTVDRRKIGPGRVEQLLEIVDDEVELLEIVDSVARPHDPAQIEP